VESDIHEKTVSRGRITIPKVTYFLVTYLPIPKIKEIIWCSVKES
jgi:hypothetical protein